ncbi:MAG: hypothetical protein ACKVUT_00305 [Gaiella sp.]
MGRDGVYCHLGVKSTTGAVVRGCRASLRRVEVAKDGKWVADQRFSHPLPLKWAHHSPDEPEAEAKDIAADSPVLLDVMFTDEAHPGIAFFVTTDTKPRGIPTALEPGAYLLTVRVEPADSPSIDFKCVASVLGNLVSLSPYIEGPPPTPPSSSGQAFAKSVLGPVTASGAMLAGPTGPVAMPGEPTPAASVTGKRPAEMAQELLGKFEAQIGAIWEGQSVLSTEHGTGPVDAANALLRQARPICARYYAEQQYRLGPDIPDGASASHVESVLTNALPALHGFKNRYSK